MIRSPLASRAVALSALVLLAGCSKEIDFTIPVEVNPITTAGVTYTTVFQVDLATQASDAWSHKDKVKDIGLASVTALVTSMATPSTTGSGDLWLRPDSATTSASDVKIASYTNQTIANQTSITVNLTNGSLSIVNDALAGDGKFKVVATGTTAANANFWVEFTLHMTMNYKIIG